MTNGLKKIKKSTMAELIIDQILQMIEDGTFVPGQKLPSEKKLAEILCVSRPTLREAMRSLMSMGLIEIRCGDGTYLNDSVKLLSEHFKNTHLFNRFSINELIDTRLLLETQMAYLAAQNATEEDLADLEAAYERIAGTLDDSVRDFHSIDFSFHMAVASCSKNRFMKEMLSAVEDLLVLLNVSAPVSRETRQQSIASSRELVDAIRAKDAEAARTIMYRHIADTGENIRRQHNCEVPKEPEGAEQK